MADDEQSLFARLVELARLAQASPDKSPEAVVDEFIDVTSMADRRLLTLTARKCGSDEELYLEGLFHRNNERDFRKRFNRWLEAQPDHHFLDLSGGPSEFGPARCPHDHYYDLGYDINKDTRDVAAIVKMSRNYVGRNALLSLDDRNLAPVDENDQPDMLPKAKRTKDDLVVAAPTQ